LLDTVRTANQSEFGKLTEPHRRALELHCYRMLGSFQDAEDLVQETLMRAWQKLGTYEGRGSFRGWLYKIATNACLDALDRRPKRKLPQMQRPASNPIAPPEPPVMEPIWLEPIPNDLLVDLDQNPEARYAARESISLAFLAAIQILPPRQRAVLILRDVLDWSAEQAAQLFGLTLSSVNSVLHRARKSMAKHYHVHGIGSGDLVPSDDATRELLDRYVCAWETSDLDGLMALLKEEATFPMPPSPSWYKGKSAIRTFIAHTILVGDERGRYRLIATGANGQPAFGWYRSNESGTAFQLFAIQALTFDGPLIADITTFMNPGLFAKFKLPYELKA
jgi:RNA polymerase sigma-70 factor, ECF subfamily